MMPHFHITISRRTLHYRQPAMTSRGVYTERLSFYVTLTDPDDETHHGVGECATLPDLSCDAMPPEQYEAQLRMFCDQLATTGEIPVDAMRPFPSMLFGLESALAQYRSGDGFTLYDTPFSRAEVGLPINGLVWMGSYDEMFARLEEKLKQGYHCVKLKIGAIDFDRELSLVQHIRQCYSPDVIELRVDANGGFSPQCALDRLKALAPYHIHSIEQPIRQHQWRQMAQLCQASPIPIALDEELIGVNTLDEKRRLLDTLCPQYIVLKPSLHGGISGTCEWIALAQERGIGSWITSALESNVGLNAIAQLAAQVYGSEPAMAQGLGTGQLFTDNVPMPLQIKNDLLWITHRF